MIILSRYRYIPINYNDYFRKYMHSLKTGELLVDLTEHDIYVTEEGFNIPIPTTKKLREAVIDFLDNDLAGINLQKKELPNNINRLYNLKQQIENQQYIAREGLVDIQGKIPNIDNTRVIVNKINESNVNQLGDLHLDLNSIKNLSNADRIEAVVNRFNFLNNSAQSVMYDGTSTANNAELMSLWNELYLLMAEAHGKLDRLGRFSGDITTTSTSTTRKTVYDVQYHQRLWNFSYNWYASSESQYISRCKALEPYFVRWFKGQAYQDIAYNDMFDWGGKGTGLFYKNFPNKYNFTTGSTRATKHNAWDLFEGLPTVDYPNKPAGYNLNYMFSDTNRAYPDLAGRGAYASSSDFTSKIISPGSARGGGARYSWGGARWQGPHNGKSVLYTNNSLLDLVSTVDNTGMQRIPRSTKNNGRLGAFSNQVPTVPSMTRAVMFLSTANILNRDGLIMRLGVKKNVNVTIISYNHKSFNENTGWT